MFLAPGLLVAGAQNSHQVHTQGIAYILLAKHYAAGNFDLAVSSYWSPLLSWLLALDLKAGWGDLAALLIVVVVLRGLLIGKRHGKPAKGLRGRRRLIWRLCRLGGLFCPALWKPDHWLGLGD